MSSALTLAYKEHPQNPEESDQEYDDRMTIKALLKLYRKKNRTEEEEKEFKYLEGECIAVQVSRGGYLPSIHSDKEMRPAAKRLHEKLSEQFGEKSSLKTMLIDRLVAAWNMALVYETQLSIAKYKKNDDGTITLSYNECTIKFLREARKGIESANDQIIRLAQTIQNLTNPPIQIKATNAFIAQNQQVNQNPPPKDLARIPTPSAHDEAGS